MNPRAEAFERIVGRYEARVLEHSPPAINSPPWFADDPVARGDVPAGRLVVSPVGTGDLRWADLVADDPSLAGWCSDRWLAAYRRLGPAPSRLVGTRVALHRLTERAISPARRKANGKIGLRYTPGGVGTPFFGSSVLDELRFESATDAEPSRVQLWPEHFDLAVELGRESRGARATYGLSPGDEQHPQPYAYVAPWVVPPPGGLWQAEAFSGGELPYSTLLEAGDQRGAVLSFFADRLAALVG